MRAEDSSRPPAGKAATAARAARDGISARLAPSTCEGGRVPVQPLTLRGIVARPVVLKLKRPVVARIATITEWPLILIDLQTEEGVVGRAYLEPYIVKSMRYLVPALRDLGELLKGRRVSPVEFYETARRSLQFV